MRVGPGDEVVTQSHTFVATVEAILECGATPVIADVDWTLNMDPEDLERKLTPRTKVILPVHIDRKSTRLNSSHSQISYAVFCLKKKKNKQPTRDNSCDTRL